MASNAARPVPRVGSAVQFGQGGSGIRQRRPRSVLKVTSQCFGPMPDLSLARQFEHETQARAIDACTDLEELRALAKSLLKAWHMQAEMTQHYGAQALGVAPRF